MEKMCFPFICGFSCCRRFLFRRLALLLQRFAVGRFLFIWGFLTGFMFGPTVAWADEDAFDKLVTTLQEHKNYRVRLQAALVLARRNDKGTPDVLIKCLQADSHHLVRGICATGLGSLGSIEAKPALEAARKDRSAYVRKRSILALQVLHSVHVPAEPPDWTIPPPPRARSFVMLGSMASKSGKISRVYRRRMQQAFWKMLGQNKEIALGLTKFKAPESFVRKHRLKSFILDASVTKLKAENIRQGNMYQKKITAEISVTLAAAPNMNIVMMTLGTATAIQEHKGRRSRKEERLLFHRLKFEAIDSAARRAAQNVIGFLKR